jgi:ABC-type lipoprotein export system ATPase subunit
MPEPLVRTERASRTYRVDGTENTAVVDATLEISAGARIGLMGPSGSGKTTLLHLLAGLDTPSAGLVEWPALGARDSLRPSKIAIAFQGPSLIPALDVSENVGFPLLLGGAAETEAASEAAAMLARMGLSDLAHKVPDELSGGQAQRVGLARALVVRPALLLADEPTGQQDRAHAARLLDLLLEVAAERGTAVLIATHDASVADRLETRWAMNDGVLSTGGARDAD